MRGTIEVVAEEAFCLYSASNNFITKYIVPATYASSKLHRHLETAPNNRVVMLLWRRRWKRQNRHDSDHRGESGRKFSHAGLILSALAHFCVVTSLRYWLDGNCVHARRPFRWHESINSCEHLCAYKLVRATSFKKRSQRKSMWRIVSNKSCPSARLLHSLFLYGIEMANII